MKSIHTLAICATIFFVGFSAVNAFNNSTTTAKPPAQKWQYLQVVEIVENYLVEGIPEGVYAYHTDSATWKMLMPDVTLQQAMNTIGANGWELVMTELPLVRTIAVNGAGGQSLDATRAKQDSTGGLVEFEIRKYHQVTVFKKPK